MTDLLDVSMSPECAELFAALAAFQGEVVPPRKTATNPHFKSKFADLADVLEAVRAPLAKHGLSLTQMAVGACDGYVRVVTLVGHKSGQWCKGVLDMPLAQKTPQGVGSAISYARRYCAMAALGIAAEDDDGERAEGRGPAGVKQAQPRTNNVSARDVTMDASKLVQQLVADLDAAAADRETLARFYEYARGELAQCGATEQQKTVVQEAFGKRCASAGLRPREVISGRAA
jgi:hypothetical protein